jgi:putative Mg2+ transporter-C (MgtC) family protein
MTGIGFLDAGTIVKDDVVARRFTPATYACITSAMGILAGAGFFFILLLGTLCTLFSLLVLRKVGP